MRRFIPNPDEVILIKQNCLQMRGPLGHAGELILTNQRLAFLPNGALQRLTGAQAVEAPLEKLTGSRPAMYYLSNVYEVTFEDEIWRFWGIGARRVHERLLSLLEEQAKGPSSLSFVAGERVLVQGTIYRHTNELMTVKGEITLSSHRLRFEPSSMLDKLVFRKTRLDLHLDDVRGARIVGLRRRLEVVGPSGSMFFDGSLCDELLDELMNDGIGEPTTEIPGASLPTGVLERWEGKHHRGILAHPGNIDIRPDKLSFTPTGRLDVGASTFDIEFAKINRVGLGGWPDRHIIITTNKSATQLSTADTSGRYRSLIPLVLEAMTDPMTTMEVTEEGEEGEEITTTEDVLDVESLLAPWSKTIELPALQRPLAWNRAMYWNKQHVASSGWLILTEAELYFVPRTAPGRGTDLLMLPVQRTLRVNPTEEEEQEEERLHMKVDGEVYSFSPMTGERFKETFWNHCSEGEARHMSEEEITAALARLEGEVLYAAIYLEEEPVVRCKPAIFRLNERGLALLVDGVPDVIRDWGTEVAIEAGQPEGLYQFEAKIESWRTAPPELRRRFKSQKLRFAMLGWPQHIRFFNRRTGYRVERDEIVATRVLTRNESGKWAPTGARFNAHLLNLSIGGCAIATASDLDLGTRVQFDLPIGNAAVQVKCEVVYADPPMGPEEQWNHGLMFSELRDATTDRIHRELLRLQREALAEKSE